MVSKKLIILPILVSLVACSNDANRYSFRHLQAKTDYDDSMYYEDNYFDIDSTTYSPQLASASICFALASFASSEGDYTHKFKNAEKLLNKLGFADFSTNDFYKRQPETDSIGVLAANKKIGEYTLVAVGIRGAGYESEWASNVTLGNREDGYHQGFREAAEHYIAFLKNYITSYNIEGDIKIWATGYSRAGATCNIACGLMDEQIAKGEKLFGDNVSITKEHLYSYCFEPPMGAPKVCDDENNIIVKGDRFNNIFNILNFNDPVPLAAMTELGFTRYGIDYVLPDPINTLHYQEHFDKMNDIYMRKSNHDAIGDYKINDFSYLGGKSGFSLKPYGNSHKMSQGLLLREFLNILSIVGLKEASLDFYVNNVQAGLRAIFATLYKSGSFKGSLIDLGVAMINDLGLINEVDILIADLLRVGVDAFIQDIRPIIVRGFNKLKMDIDINETMKNLISFLAVVGSTAVDVLSEGKSYLFLSFISKTNISAIGSAHYPELCESHVKAMDSRYKDNPYNGPMDGKYYKLVVEDNTTVIKITNEDNLIVNINDGDEIDNRIPYLKRRTGYEIYLPYHEKYTVKLDKYTDINVSYYDSKKDNFVPVEVILDSSNQIVIDSK